MTDHSKHKIIDYILKKAQNHKENCLMLSVPDKLKKKLHEIGDSIDESKLAKKGLIKDTHITVLFGMDDKAKEELKNLDFGPITITSKTKIEYFDNKDEGCTYVVVKIKSKELSKLHSHLKENFNNKDSFQRFIPHISIACMKLGERLPDTKINKFTWEAKEMIFRNKDNSSNKIKLGNKNMNKKSEVFDGTQQGTFNTGGGSWGKDLGFHIVDTGIEYQVDDKLKGEIIDKVFSEYIKRKEEDRAYAEKSRKK